MTIGYSLPCRHSLPAHFYISRAMKLNKIKNIFLKQIGSQEDQPFGPDVTVFKVRGKMFGLISLKDKPLRINLKCAPDEAEQLRYLYESVIPGYHMNKKHWITIFLNDELPEEVITALADGSYGLVVDKLSRADKLKLG